MITAVNQTLAETLATIAKFAADNGARLEGPVTVGDVSFVLVLAEPEPVVEAQPKDEWGPLGPPAFRDPRKASQ